MYNVKRLQELNDRCLTLETEILNFQFRLKNLQEAIEDMNDVKEYNAVYNMNASKLYKFLFKKILELKIIHCNKKEKIRQLRRDELINDTKVKLENAMIDLHHTRNDMENLRVALLTEIMEYDKAKTWKKDLAAIIKTWKKEKEIK